ncbi:hypothetical protein HK107_05685 [Parvularcula sp. ZS-1/3]|uniref:Uncharacterized protein n=1 Tax=Parvularcula mediterranea TaxID=2732508 RepID=A0A7Y3RLJ4_9PROT|nr:hypothetical protein [Parvularcula mediterranea]NNU15810.1 hypothetical protein [Parvularcula mediterranea]
MSFGEKSNFAILVALLVSLALYGAHLTGFGLRIGAFSSILGAVIGFIVLAVIGHIIIAIAGGKGSDLSDERDRDVDLKTDRLSELTLTAVILGLIAYGIAQDDMLLANIAFFGLFGGALVKAIAKLVLYRMAA